MNTLESLEDVVNRLREQARKEPMDVIAKMQSQDMSPPTAYAFIEVAGYSCHVQLTLNKMGLKHWWHLSVAQKLCDADTPKALPDHIVQLLKNNFLATVGRGNTIEVPSTLYPGIVRQFIRQEL